MALSPHTIAAHLKTAATSRFWNVFLFCILLLAAVIILLQYSPLLRRFDGDPALTSYIALMVTKNVAPYQGVYEVRTALAPLWGAVMIYAGTVFGLAPLLALRFGMVVVDLLCLIALYFLGWQVTGRRMIGILSAVFMLGFDYFAARPSLGMEVKIFCLLFGLLALLALTKRRWFTAGLWGACAGLSWQVGFGYAVLALLLALVQTPHGKARLRAVSAVLAGSTLGIALYVAYFASQEALLPMWQQSVLALTIGRAQSAAHPVEAIRHMLLVFRHGYSGEILIGILALAGLAAGAVWLARPRRAVYFLFTNPRTSGTLLAFAGLFAASMLDFQSFPDWIPLLPFLALFAAGVVSFALEQASRVLHLSPPQYRLAQMTLLLAAALLAFWNVPWSARAFQFVHGGALAKQDRVVAELQRRYPVSAPLLLFGKEGWLFQMERVPLDRHTFLLRNSDAVIEQFEPEGFDGWLGRLKAQHPEAVFVSRLGRGKFAQRERYQKMFQWLTTQYVKGNVCSSAQGGSLYVRSDLRAQFRAQTRPGDCFSLS